MKNKKKKQNLARYTQSDANERIDLVFKSLISVAV